MSTPTRRKKRDRKSDTNAINSTVATAPITNNTTATFTQRMENIEKISTPTPTHQKKRAKSTGTNATNDTVATTNSDTIQLQNLTTQLSQVTDIQSDQQNQIDILRGENNTKQVKKNDETQLLTDENNELRRELKTEIDKLKTEFEAKINEMKVEFKKQLEDLKKKDSTGDSRSGSSVVAFGNDELSNTEHSTITQEVQSRLSTTTNNNNVVKNIKKTKELLLHNCCIEDVLIFTSKNNEKMVATSNGYSIKITRISDNKLVKTIENAHDSNINNLVMTKINNNDVIASGGYLGTVKFWSIDNFEEVASFKCYNSVYCLAAYELNGKNMLACGLSHGSIELWDVQSIKKVDTLKCDVYTLEILHTFKFQNKTHLLSVDGECKLNLWCLDENKLVKTLRKNQGKVRSLATFDLDNDLLIAAGVGYKLMLWKMSNLKEYHQLNRQDDSGITGLKPFMSNERAMLASVSEGGWFRVFDVKEKQVVHEVMCEDRRFSSLDVFEEDGNYVFIAGGEIKRTYKGFMVFLK